MRIRLGVPWGALAVVIAAAEAHGQAVPFAGCTFAAFDAPAPSLSCGTFQSTTLGGFTWEYSTFSGVTVAGVGNLNGAMNGPGGIEADNYGAWYGDGTPFDYTGHTFHLRVQFTTPGLGSVEFVGNLNGVYDPPPAGTGTPFLTFPGSFQSFPFTSGGGAGTVTVGVHNFAIGTCAACPNPGLVTIALTAVPEPSTAALVAMGLVGVVGGARRRERAGRR